MQSLYLKIRFYGSLNDFLPEELKHKDIEYTYLGRQSVKDLIESIGPPHTEVWMILIQGMNVGFEYIVQPGDYISVYPKFFNISYPLNNKIERVIPSPPRFIADVNLGRMTKYLRLAGFDTYYRNDLTDIEIAKTSALENLIVLSRDVGLLKRKEINIAYMPRSDDPLKQAKEAIDYFELKDQISPFTICMDCGGRLEPVKKEDVKLQLQPNTKKFYEDFFVCSICKKVYWKGSHWESMQEIIKFLRS